MPEAKAGDTVTVHYTGKLDDGSVFDTSLDREPLQFKIGEGEIIPGFEEGLLGMQPGESKTVVIFADDAYGMHHDELVIVVKREELPQGMDPQVGQQLRIGQDGGESIVVVVAEATADQVTLDANHPLAGKDLTFDLELVEIA